MRGVGVIGFGGPEALQVVDLPEVHAGPGELRIRAHAARVNPTDTYVRNGARGEAGPVRRSGELLNDPHFRARSFFEDAERPVIGTHTHGYRWAQFSDAPRRLRRSAPSFGEHNRGILVGEFGLTASDLQDLIRDAVIGDTLLGGSRV